MIQSLAINEFQSHFSSLLEFDPGVNVIIGDSDGGKTAILRALTWVLTNRPTGEAFRRIGTDKTIVSVTTSDGSISRARSNKDNYYLDGAGEKLAAIGTSVPEPVLKLLNMDADLNLQRQLDAPFLLSCSAGEVAQRPNAVVGLDDIDVGLSNAARRVRQNQASYEEAVKRHGELSEQVESFAYLKQMELSLVEIEQQSGELSQAQVRADVLTDVLGDVVESHAAISQLPDVDGLLSRLMHAEQQLENYNKIWDVIDMLSKCVLDIGTTSEALGKIVDVDGIQESVEQTEEMISQIDKMRSAERTMHALVEELAAIDAALQKATKELMKQEERYHRETPTVCPLCGRKGRKG